MYLVRSTVCVSKAWYISFLLYLWSSSFCHVTFLGMSQSAAAMISKSLHIDRQTNTLLTLGVSRITPLSLLHETLSSLQGLNSNLRIVIILCNHWLLLCHRTVIFVYKMFYACGRGEPRHSMLCVCLQTGIILAESPLTEHTELWLNGLYTEISPISFSFFFF